MEPIPAGKQGIGRALHGNGGRQRRRMKLARAIVRLRDQRPVATGSSHQGRLQKAKQKCGASLDLTRQKISDSASFRSSLQR